MSRRLGEILVGAGKITEGQLHRALTAQLVFGGHLGTGLLELGYLDEETLGETLSAMFGVPYANFDTLSKVPYSVVRSLPAKLVQKHRVVPLRLEGKTLHLAMIDPKNLLALDEISFVTGYRIAAWVSPEVRIFQMLEKYYNLQRTQRFAMLARELSRLRSSREKLHPLESEKASPGAGASPERSALLHEAAAAGSKTMESDGQMPSPASSPPMGRRPLEALVDHWEKYGYGRAWQDVADAIEGDPKRSTEGEEVDTNPQPAASPAPDSIARDDATAAPSLMEVSRRLATAESVDEIVRITLSFASARFSRTIFFVAKEDRAVGWAGSGAGISTAGVTSLAIPLSRGSPIFSLVEPGRSHYLGPVPPPQAEAGGFYERLAVEVPRAILLVPLVVRDRVTAYLYADSADREIPAHEVVSSLTLCARASLALQIILLRNKILAT